MNADVQELCGVSVATENRIHAHFAADDKLIKRRVNGHWEYQIWWYQKFLSRLYRVIISVADADVEINRY